MTAKTGVEALSTKLFYGFGSVAYGVKSNGFSYFLLFFYERVVGLDGFLAGVALLIVMTIDAVSDPLVGHTSDNWRSKWGRRHPFMYFSAIPVAITYYYLWVPPEGMSQVQIFVYLIFFAAMVRTFITMYEIPSTSLAPEFTDDYDQRTSFLSYRYFFGWWGGLTIAVLGYLVFFKATPEYSFGQINPEAWPRYGAFAAMIIFVAILVSSIGTHKHIPVLRQPPPKTNFTFRKWVGEFIETLSNRNFLVLFISAILASMAGGVNASLVLYFNTFFWELPAIQIGILNLVYFLSAVLALVLMPYVSKGRNKQHVAITVWMSAAVVMPLPIMLRVIGLFPEPGSDWLLPLLMVHGLIDVMLFIMAGILVSSMIADLVEDSAKKTGRRSEGLFFAGDSFARKIVHGFGILSAGSILSIVGFPDNAAPGEVEWQILRNMALIYAPLVLIFYSGAILVLKKYKITRDSHSENLEIIESQLRQ
jgi:Na+/melibiose symporter-like transporter